MQLRSYPIEALRRRADQPRKQFDDAKLDELAQSIGENGLLEPIVVRPRDDGSADIIAGERRWIACQRAGLKDVPCVLRDVEDEAEAKVLALIENIQRVDLSPIEKAEALRAMIDEEGMSHTEAARRVGRSPGWVSHSLALLELPDQIRQLIRDGKVSLRHAVALRAANGNAVELAERVAAEGLSTRELERAIKAGKKRRRSRAKTVPERDLELRFQSKLGLKTEVKWGPRKGRIILHIPNLDVLDGLVERLEV